MLERPDPVVIDSILEREKRLGRYDYPDPQDFELLAAEIRWLRENYSETCGGE